MPLTNSDQTDRTEFDAGVRSSCSTVISLENAPVKENGSCLFRGSVVKQSVSWDAYIAGRTRREQEHEGGDDSKRKINSAVVLKYLNMYIHKCDGKRVNPGCIGKKTLPSETLPTADSQSNGTQTPQTTSRRKRYLYVYALARRSYLKQRSRTKLTEDDNPKKHRHILHTATPIGRGYA